MNAVQPHSYYVTRLTASQSRHGIDRFVSIPEIENDIRAILSSLTPDTVPLYQDDLWRLLSRVVALRQRSDALVRLQADVLLRLSALAGVQEPPGTLVLTGPVEPMEITGPSLSAGNAVQGDPLTYTAGVWPIGTEVSAVLWVDADPIRTIYPGEVFGPPVPYVGRSIRIIETGVKDGVEVLSTSPLITVLQANDAGWIARETLSPGTIPVTDPSTPRIGTATYLSSYHILRSAAGGLEHSTAPSSDPDYDGCLVSWSTGNNPHEISASVDNLQQCNFFRLNFGMAGGTNLYDGGPDSGYQLEIVRYNDLDPFDVVLKSYPGGGGNGSVLVTGATIPANSESVVLTMPTAFTGTGSGETNMGLSWNRKVAGSPLVAFDSGYQQANEIPLDDLYRTTYVEDWSDNNLARINTAGTIPAGSSNAWKWNFPWGPDTPINNARGRMTFPGDKSFGHNPFFIGENRLNITAIRSPAQYENDHNLIWDGAATVRQDWLTGVVRSTMMAQKYGYFGVRARMPPGSGMWPELWLLELFGIWPWEFDLAEARGEDLSQIHQNTHAPNPANPGISIADNPGWKDIPITGNAADINEYGVEWTPEIVRFYINGKLSYQRPNFVHTPMYPLFSLSVSSGQPIGFVADVNANTPSPSVLEIHAFEVHQRRSFETWGPSIISRPTISSPTGTNSCPPGTVLTATSFGSGSGTVYATYWRRGAVKIPGTDDAVTYTTNGTDDEGRSINLYREWRTAAGHPSYAYSDFVYNFTPQ